MISLLCIFSYLFLYYYIFFYFFFFFFQAEDGIRDRNVTGVQTCALPISDNLREVGSQLGVANILEGSVQKIANAAHINVQLIRTATDEHIWAESYNRKLDDVFSVEGEVATAIAEQLNAKLTGAEHKEITNKPTNNPVAYDAYLRGVAIEHNQYGYESYQHAVTAYAQAVQLDPKFALAWARLAVLRSFLFFNSIDRNANTPSSVQEAADRAMALAPEAGESWVAKGAY